MEQPKLFVFAGPNGAGKSTLSATMLPSGTPVFDGDKELARLRQQFPGLDSGNLYDAVNGHIFANWKEQVQAKRMDCAFETNFRSADVMSTVQEFKDKGYQAQLIYFGLDSLEASIERVHARVAMGGHAVALDNITANYNEGFKNLEKHFEEFDNVLLVRSFTEDNQQRLKLHPYLKIEQGQVKEQAEQIPDWANKLVRRIEQKQQQRQSLIQKKDRDPGEDLDQGYDRGPSIGR
ncbi:Predicted ABC-type ATPase [Mucilaginibacter sp. OK268]|uniref:zeta toxin family protein n=1 Tax=Mucilaginibacter sp. OK268 TaxID=1881048 RepID=UPI00088D8E43|nr:zeta toxin family protein [Mucilaginibacter sp. OK268]SDP43693.1 Predicted ABC-type ATPase [Mucilaginibacter sp. OK268]